MSGLRIGRVSSSEEVAHGIVLDFDAYDRVVGIEIEGARVRRSIPRLEVKGFPLAQRILMEQAPASAGP
ncbi:DUF2283 domain-containing protein [Thermoflexus hugenholtzii]|uniref:DUF2283 domain-containing protein n=1 Tax=Thermoflexus hugenholtzii TaxID=1495650 RepID=UPI000B50C6B6